MDCVGYRLGLNILLPHAPEFVRQFAIIMRFLLVGIAMVWLALSYRSVKGQRMAADSPMLIATGQFDDAEHDSGHPALDCLAALRSGRREAQSLYPGGHSC